MHELNREISNLQRQLIKGKYELENTLKKLSDSNEQLAHLNATKDKFFSIIAHDLKNPFSIISGFSDILIKKSDKMEIEKIQRYSENINQASNQAYALLENLLEWSRLQTGKLMPQKAELKVSDLVNDVKSLCDQMALSKDIDFQISTNESETIFADRQMILTVLRNLVTNAIKFTYPKGTIKIETRTIEKNVEFNISDNGIGIDPKYLEKLFFIDCKLSNKGTANEEGTGLGLILCKEFIEINGGRIWVESEIGKGSDFKFLIPTN